jgi:NAD(P)-dependent dehydrogenase (short-subunit alcohol dehydrogenase family)
MIGHLKGKIALVTGAGSSAAVVGTGKAISVTLARAGASVFLVDKFPERAEETRRLIADAGGIAKVFAADIARPEECEAMVAAAVQHFGGLDILVNNAAVAKYAPILETTVDDYHDIVDVNLKGAFMACKYAIPHLIARGGGSIVNIGSIASIRDSGKSQPAYAASKAGMLGLTVDLAGAHGLDNIRVNAVLPGMIVGPMAQVPGQSQSEVSSLKGVNLLGRRGDAWDIANAVLFLCSNEAAYITGVTLPVDGGATMAMPSSYVLRRTE